MPAPSPYTTANDLQTKYPVLAAVADADLTALVTEFETWVERYRGTAYRVRTATETIVVVSNSAVLPVVHNNIQSITTITYDLGTAPSTSNVYADGRRLVLKSGWWPLGTRVTVTYTHGATDPPAGILRACNRFCRNEALQDRSDKPKNTVSFSDPNSGEVYRESTSDWNAGRPTKWLDVLELVNATEDERPVFVA